MSEKPKILAFAGSAREGSYNKQLVKVAVKGAQAAGAEVTYLDLRDFPLPLYDGDLEAASGLPENAKKLKSMMLANDAFLIASPEYNSSITGLLKNTIDWASRAESGDEKPLVCFKDKVAAIMSASPGALGGLRGLVTLRSILGNIGVMVLPSQIAVPRADEAFSAEGSLKDPKKNDFVRNLGAELAGIVLKLKHSIVNQL